MMISQFFLVNKMWVFCPLAFILSLLITQWIRNYSVKKEILDIPNERSLHSLPTPRGGGIAIVFTFTLFVLFLAAIGTIDLNLSMGVVFGGLIVAAIGYCDDLYSLSPKLRIFIHILAATWGVYWIGGCSFLDMGTYKSFFLWVGYFLGITGVVWCVNFYNFMDGIDGLAGAEGVFISLTGSIVLWWLGYPSLALVLGLLMAAIAGFTFWNWPPAKIFLGDIGSGYLGYTFGILALYTANKRILPITFWGIILGVFLCDATCTLLLRVYKKKPWYKAHREHAYQELVSKGISHKYTTLIILFINLFILMPLALFVISWPNDSFWLLGMSQLLLISCWASVKLGAS